MATDQEIFDSALSEQTENTPVEATEAPTEAKPDRARDEQGKFTKAAPEAPETVETPQPVTEAVTDTHSQEVETKGVPSWRLAEEAQRRRDAEQQLADMRTEFRNMQLQWQSAQQRQQQPEQRPVDPFADPQGFADSILQTQENRLRELQLQHSLQFARFAHKDVFDKAYEEFVDYAHKTRDQAAYQRVMSSGDPGEALVQWFKDTQLQKELGGSDLKTFLDKQREEWLKDPSVQAKVIEAFKATQQQAQPSNITNIPPSLSRVSSAAPMHAGDTDASQKGIFQHAMKR